MSETKRNSHKLWAVAGAILLACGLAACQDRSEGAGAGSRGHPAGGLAAGLPGGGPGATRGEDEAAAVPVEVVAVTRRSISSFLETNGTLEAENEVDIVARTAAPIVELAAEEGMFVKQGQLLVRLDEREHRAEVELATVALREAQRNHERAKEAREASIISEADYDQALAALESAQARLTTAEIQLGYTRVVAPFDAVVIERDVKLAENVTLNQKLFRISDFDPLLCPIQVPEKELGRLELGQSAYLTVEAWPGERFGAKVLRISPVVDAATGTIKVTLEVETLRKLRPGMFASVFLETDTHPSALAIPKAALSLESLGDTVYVVDGDVAARRGVELGYEEAEYVEVLSGLSEADRVIVVGQDGLSDGTPINVLAGPGAAEPPSPAAPTQQADVGGAAADPAARWAHPQEGGAGPGAPGGGRGFGRGGQRPNLSQMTPEQLEGLKQRMRERGLSDAEIAERLKGMRERP